MAVFKCKMCGGALEINHNETVVTCEYCGTQQTLPKLDDDRRANLYDRANHFRRNNEFDKAMGIYEQILNEDSTDAEAYWSLVLCRYGIEYVEDPASRKRVPTINRAQFTSIFDDDNYKSALNNADASQKAIYEKEAKAINEIQKGILAISQKEEPFDVFICYKETDNNGRRTPDSVLAQDLYYQLKQEGFKVFFSRITLEDKLGSAYEPYIFAALNSAKVMVVLGTKPEHFNAVWVKNEWSRYLSLIKQGQKKILIPAYKDMDPYDLPEEFSHLQAQDMSKLGFMQDLIRGIKKIAQADAPKPTVVKETVVAAGSANTASLLKRAFMFLEDGDWDAADEYCEKVLDIDPECAEAYVGKLMVELKVKKQEALTNYAVPFDDSNNYQKAMRFADDKLKAELSGYVETIVHRIETERKEKIYLEARKLYKSHSVRRVEKAGDLLQTIIDYKDSRELIEGIPARKKQEEEAFKESVYSNAIAASSSSDIAELERVIETLKTISGWKDADQLVLSYTERLAELRREQKERTADINRKRQQYNNKYPQLTKKASLLQRKELLENEQTQLACELTGCAYKPGFILGPVFILLAAASFAVEFPGFGVFLLIIGIGITIGSIACAIKDTSTNSSLKNICKKIEEIDSELEVINRIPEFDPDDPYTYSTQYSLEDYYQKHNKDYNASKNVSTSTDSWLADAWICKECGRKNPKSQLFCKDCGGHKS